MLNYIGRCMILLRVCGLWQDEKPTGFWQKAYKCYYLVLQSFMLIFWAFTLFTMLSKGVGYQSILKEYFEWFQGLIIIILTKITFKTSMKHFKKLLAATPQADVSQLGWLFNKFERKTLNYIVFYGLIRILFDGLPKVVVLYRVGGLANFRDTKGFVNAITDTYQEPIYVLWKCGVALFPALYVVMDFTFFSLFAYLVQHIAAWQTQLKFTIEHCHFRSQRSVNRKKWPSDSFNGIYDIKYIVNIHKHIINLVELVGCFGNKLIMVTLLQSLMIISDVLAIVFLRQAAGQLGIIIICNLLLVMIRMFTFGYFGTLIQKENAAVHQSILYKLANPRERKYRGHPDVTSLQVLAARCNLDLHLELRVLTMRTPLTVETLNRIYGIGTVTFELLRFFFPLQPQEKM